MTTADSQGPQTALSQPPWCGTQLASINAYQHFSPQPFRCDRCQDVLLARPAGWWCRRCTYEPRQNISCPVWMTDWSWSWYSEIRKKFNVSDPQALTVAADVLAEQGQEEAARQCAWLAMRVAFWQVSGVCACFLGCLRYLKRAQDAITLPHRRANLQRALDYFTSGADTESQSAMYMLRRELASAAVGILLSVVNHTAAYLYRQAAPGQRRTLQPPFGQHDLYWIPGVNRD
jgi:hypothetical protein